ncbi:MAG TPA: flagellar motor switch protein FliN [Beijerinckiaceae bacterium]
MGEPLAYDAEPTQAPSDDLALDHVLNIPVTIDVILGSTRMSVSSLMKLQRGAVVPLDRKVGEPVEIAVNGRLVARGEVVVLEDDATRLGVSLTEIIGAAGPSGA